MTQLLNRTNEEDFYNNWDLLLDSVKGKIQTHEKSIFEINIYIKPRDESEEKEREDWQIIAYETIGLNKIFRPVYLPYIKLALLEEHPVLWKYKYDVLECELSGTLENSHEFTSKLHWLYEKETGGFIKFEEDFYELKSFINGRSKVRISISIKTYSFVKSLIDNLGLEIRIVEVLTNENKGYLHRPDAKILIFGNADVSSNYYNLGQPFVIADKFISKKKK